MLLLTVVALKFESNLLKVPGKFLRLLVPIPLLSSMRRFLDSLI
jgi:hypothetical protein